MMPKVKKPKDHMIADGERGVLQCMACGDEAPMPVGQKLVFAAAVFRGFVKAHKNCKRLQTGSAGAAHIQKD